MIAQVALSETITYFFHCLGPGGQLLCKANGCQVRIWSVVSAGKSSGDSFSRLLSLSSSSPPASSSVLSLSSHLAYSLVLSVDAPPLPWVGLAAEPEPCLLRRMHQRILMSPISYQPPIQPILPNNTATRLSLFSHYIVTSTSLPSNCLPLQSAVSISLQLAFYRGHRVKLKRSRHSTSPFEV